MKATTNLNSFFESDEVTLPVGGFEENNETFDTFMKRVFDRFIGLLRQLEDPDYPDIVSTMRSSVARIEALCHTIISALKHYLNGFPSEAYKQIEESILLVHLVDLTTSLGGGIFPKTPKIIAGPPPLRQGDDFIEARLNPPMYRIRENRTEAASGELLGKDIFHVPFEKRHLVSNERYSIAGLPCLYLGSSTWVCWDELGRPAFDEIFVSLFRMAEEVVVLDFELPPINAWKAFRAGEQELDYVAKHKLPPTQFSKVFNQSFIESYIAAWPLIAACSVKTGYKNASFHPQYIVPQMLLQWVSMAQVVDGIRYFSTRTQRAGFPYYNCAFPAREIRNEGRCAYLQQKFKLTDPIPWSILREVVLTGFVDSGPSNWETYISLSRDLKFSYRQTGFYLAEQTLKFLESEHPDWSKKVAP